MVVRWKSLANHTCDQHDDCYHLLLGERQKWFMSGTVQLNLNFTDIRVSTSVALVVLYL